MVDAQTLAALDTLLWLRTGEDAAHHLSCDQSSINRRVQTTLQLFGLERERRQGEWCLAGETTLLAMERRVHQHARWNLGQFPLRLEATDWSGQLLCTPPPTGWRLGGANIVGVNRSLQLLRERIVDAWLAGLPDGPTSDDPDLAVIPLARMPVWFVVALDHPLRQLAHPRIADGAACASWAFGIRHPAWGATTAGSGRVAPKMTSWWAMAHP